MTLSTSNKSLKKRRGGTHIYIYIFFNQALSRECGVFWVQCRVTRWSTWGAKSKRPSWCVRLWPRSPPWRSGSLARAKRRQSPCWMRWVSFSGYRLARAAILPVGQTSGRLDRIKVAKMVKRGGATKSKRCWTDCIPWVPCVTRCGHSPPTSPPLQLLPVSAWLPLSFKRPRRQPVVKSRPLAAGPNCSFIFTSASSSRSAPNFRPFNPRRVCVPVLVCRPRDDDLKDLQLVAQIVQNLISAITNCWLKELNCDKKRYHKKKSFFLAISQKCWKHFFHIYYLPIPTCFQWSPSIVIGQRRKFNIFEQVIKEKNFRFLFKKFV